jgi:hypothetical protein
VQRPTLAFRAHYRGDDERSDADVRERVRAVRMQRERGDSWVQIPLSWSDNDAYPLGSSETIVISADYTLGCVFVQVHV